MGLSSSEVFDKPRTGENTLSARMYILAMTIFISGGLLLSAYAASYTYNMKPNWLLLFGTFAVSIIGIFMSANSENWLVSLFGYGIVVVAMGMMTGPYVHMYTLASVIKILFVTIGVTLGIGIAGAIYPKSVASWGGFLLVALFGLIIGQFIAVFAAALGAPAALFKSSMHLLDWAGVFLFSGFVFYDMNRAMRMDYTLDNAVDNSVALYLDIINLFIRLLELFGKKSDD